MPHEHIAQYHGKMLGHLRSHPYFSCLDDADREDAVQTVLLEVLAKRADFLPTEAAWGTYLCKAAEYAAGKIRRERERERERGWFQSLCGELESEVKDSPALRAVDEYGQPDDIAAEVERRGRQKRLLSDILKEYVRHCEQRGMQTQREIYERTLRSQNAKHIMASMGVTRANIDQHRKKTRDWIIDRMQQADVERSVFRTYLQPTRDVTLLPDSVPADVPRNRKEVLMRVVNEFHALCPSDERLALFEQQPQAAEFSDLRYHIEEVPCLWCQARRSLK